MGRRKCLDFIIVISYLTLISNVVISTLGSSYIFTHISTKLYIVRLYVAAVPLDSRYPQNRIVHLFAYNKLYYSVNNTGILVYYNVYFNISAVSMSFFFFFIRPDTFDHVSRVHRRAVHQVYIYFYIRRSPVDVLRFQ